MKEQRVKIRLENSLESTPIAVLVQKANEYRSNIFIGEDNRQVNAKSIMGMMSVNFGEDKDMLLTVDGEDEDKAISELVAYFETM